MNDTKLILNAIETMGNRFDSLESRFDSLEGRFDSLEGEVKTIKAEVRSINLTLENEIARNIGVIAEGHTILERKLDESLKVNQEKELLLIRVNHLENEVRKLKEQINGIA